MSNFRWFIDKRKLVIVDRDLAMVVGLDKAIVLNQLHYWLNNDNAGVYFEGEKWIYNTYEEWKNGIYDATGKQIQEPNFPFWSVRTIQRLFLGLEERGLVISRQINKASWNHKKYYRIDYDVVNDLMSLIVPL